LERSVNGKKGKTFLNGKGGGKKSPKWGTLDAIQGKKGKRRTASPSPDRTGKCSTFHSPIDRKKGKEGGELSLLYSQRMEKKKTGGKR